MSTSTVESLILFIVIALIVTVFFLFIRHDAPFAHSNAFGRHLNFDHYHMDTIIKVLYFFTLIVNTLIAFVFMAFANEQLSNNGEGNVLIAFLVGLLVFAVLQFLSRMVHESVIMYVNMAQDVREIRDACGYNRVPASVSVTPAPAQQDATPKPSFAERASAMRNAASRVASKVASGLADEHESKTVVVPVVPEKVPEKVPDRVSAEDSWVCDSCGTLVYNGKFCPKCGSRGPIA